jgi:glutamyl-tRNA reductase
MNVQVVGCSHHQTALAVRERLAFTPQQAQAALDQWRSDFSGVESVLLSTCNRVEIYSASEEGTMPSIEDIAAFLSRFHKLNVNEVVPHLYSSGAQAAIAHLFTVAASLDSMVLGETQILAQVKQAYQAAIERDAAGPLLHQAFQAAIRVARRVAAETGINQHRISVPSVAVSDFGRQIFERFDDKNTLVIGAGEMAEETLRYLRDEGARQITVVNRNFERASELAARWQGSPRAWEELLRVDPHNALAQADVIVSTTGASEPIMTLALCRRILEHRRPRPLFVLDLAVPRDFEAEIGKLPDVYLYTIDDLQATCQSNRALRDRALPAARKIVDQETARFMADLYHRATAPMIQRLREDWHKVRDEELRRLFNRRQNLDAADRDEIQQFVDRLLNKLLHPPLESLRDESRDGVPHGLLDALARLFRLRD